MSSLKLRLCTRSICNFLPSNPIKSTYIVLYYIDSTEKYSNREHVITDRYYRNADPLYCPFCNTRSFEFIITKLNLKNQKYTLSEFPATVSSFLEKYSHNK